MPFGLCPGLCIATGTWLLAAGIVLYQPVRQVTAALPIRR
jgi:hypothetical protein